MKAYQIFIRHFFLLLPLSLTGMASRAQSLPNKQANSVYLPNALKIDGRSDEWNNKFQAYNKHTDLFYTIANDDSKIYLIVQIVDPVVIQKTIIGGLTFTIKPMSKENKSHNITLTFPSIDKKDRGLIEQHEKQLSALVKVTERDKSRDSLTKVINKEFFEKSVIKIGGISAIEDSVISIYNINGIKTKAIFDKTNVYTCEIVIPMKYIESNINNGKLNYNIQLNGRFYNTGTNAQLTSDGRATIRSTPGYSSVVLTNTSQSMTLDYPTDFSGDYILAIK